MNHTRLLSYFKSLPRENHPWWWPAGSGSTLRDWGLEEAQIRAEELDPDEVLQSLRFGTRSPTEKIHCEFKGFCGSVVPPTSPIRWVLTIRPSQSRFQQAGTRKLYELLERLGILAATHVTDVVKFRGDAPAMCAWSTATPQMKATSLELLREEFEARRPETVIVSGGDTLKALERMLRQVLETEGWSASAEVLDDIHSRAVATYFYSARFKSQDVVFQNWRRALEANERVHTPAWLARKRRERCRP